MNGQHSDAVQQFEVPVYQSRREVLMALLADNVELVQWHMEDGIANLPWGLGPLVALGIKRTYKIPRTELWRLPMRLLAEMSDAKFDNAYETFFPFIRDL